MNTIPVRTIILAGLTALVALQCDMLPTQTGEGNNAEVSDGPKSFASLSGDVLIDIPGCIAADQTPSLSKRSAGYGEDAPGEAIELYDGIRDFIGFANEVVNNNEWGVRAQILFWRDTLNWKYIEEAGEVSGTEGDYQWTASFDPSRTFAYHLVITLLSAAGEPIALKIEFNGDFELPAGRVYYNIGLLDEKGGESGELTVDFKKTSSQHLLDIAFTDEYKEGGPKDQIGSGVIHCIEEGGILHVSGSAYYPDLDIILDNSTGYCYTFKGAADMNADQAIMNLGIPPADYGNNDDAIYTTYGLADMVLEAIIAEEIPTLNDTLKSIIVTSYTDNMTIEEIVGKIVMSGNMDFLYPPEEIDNMTIGDFRTFLTINESVSDPQLRADISGLLWVSALTQPVYFNSAGYAGNGDDVPAGFGNLAGIDVLCETPVPSEVATLQVAP
jgi:hypothetical protein